VPVPFCRARVLTWRRELGASCRVWQPQARCNFSAACHMMAMRARYTNPSALRLIPSLLPGRDGNRAGSDDNPLPVDRRGLRPATVGNRFAAAAFRADRRGQLFFLIRTAGRYNFPRARAARSPIPPDTSARRAGAGGRTHWPRPAGAASSSSTTRTAALSTPG